MSPPAGWAAYAGREAVCRLILNARVDPFQLIDFDMAERLPELLQQSPWLLSRRFREYAPWEPTAEEWVPEPWHTPLVWAVVKNRVQAVRVLLEHGAAA